MKSSAPAPPLNAGDSPDDRGVVFGALSAVARAKLKFNSVASVPHAFSRAMVSPSKRKVAASGPAKHRTAPRAFNAATGELEPVPPIASPPRPPEDDVEGDSVFEVLDETRFAAEQHSPSAPARPM